MGQAIDFDTTGLQVAGAGPSEKAVDFDMEGIKPATETGFFKGAARSFGVGANEMVGGVMRAVGSLVGAGPIQDGILDTAQSIVDVGRQFYQPEAEEVPTIRSRVGGILGGVAPYLATGIAAPAVMGASAEMNRAADVLARGGTQEEAQKAGLVSGAASAAGAMIPMGVAGSTLERAGIQSTAGKLAAGGASGAAAGAAIGPATRTAENVGLPERPEFADLRQENTLQDIAKGKNPITLEDIAAGAAFGAHGAILHGGKPATKPGEAAGGNGWGDQPFKAAEQHLVPVPTEAGGTDYITPNGQRISPEQWEGGTPTQREGWMKPEAAGKAPVEGFEPAAEAPPEPKPAAKIAELERLKSATTDADVQGELDTRIEAEKQAIVDRGKGEQYAKLAEATADPDLKTEFEKQAEKLGYEKPVVPISEAKPERRVNVEQRKTIAEMTPEEMKQELLTSDVTGINNRRAYDDAPKGGRTETSVDADSLKWINDSMSHDTGDQMLKQIGAAFKAEAGGNGYHISGDEFKLLSDDPATAEATMQKINDRLAKVRIEHTLPDGTVITKQGIGVSYGHGKNAAEAERLLQENKQERERAQLRPQRGAEPPGIHRQAPGAENIGAGVGTHGGVREGAAERNNEGAGRGNAPIAAKQTGREKFEAANPFLTFLGRHGVDIKHQLDLTGNKGKAGQRMIPYHGPMFKKAGEGLDELAQRAVDSGFMTNADLENPKDNGGVNHLSDLIRKAYHGEKVEHIEVAGAERMAKAHEDALFSEAEKLGIKTKGKTIAHVEDDLLNHMDAAWRGEHGLNDADAARAINVRRAMDIDEAGVERAALQHENDDTGFDRAIQEIINGEPQTVGRGGERNVTPAGEVAPRKTVEAPARTAETQTGGEAAIRGAGRAGGTRAEPNIAAGRGAEPGRAEFAGQAGAGIAENDIPPEYFANTKVRMPVYIEDEGKTTFTKVPAREALADIRKEKKQYERLLDCIRGSA